MVLKSFNLVLKKCGKCFLKICRNPILTITKQGKIHQSEMRQFGATVLVMLFR